MNAPRIWALWPRVYGLDARVARDLWRAVLASQYSTVIAFRQALLFFDQRVLGDPATAVQTLWAPERLTEVIEALVSEGRVTRRTATRIEEAMLVMVTKDGAWY